MGRYKFSERKKKFAEYFLTPRRRGETGGNAYRSALRAGYSESYAKKIMSRMRWTELSIIAEKSGIIMMDDDTREYAYEIENIRNG